MIRIGGIVLVTLAVFSFPARFVRAADTAPSSAAARAAKADLKREIEQAEKAYNERVLAAQERYKAALTAAKIRAINQKELDEALAIETELKSVADTIAKLHDKLAGTAGPATVTVSGSGFELADFANDQRAFSNRTYNLTDIPNELRGWRFTRVAGNGSPTIHIHVTGPGVLLAASSKPVDMLEGQGWAIRPGYSFHFSDRAKTEMVILAKHVEAGDDFDVPQSAVFSGTMVLLPPADSAKEK